MLAYGGWWVGQGKSWHTPWKPVVSKDWIKVGRGMYVVLSERAV